MATNEQIGECTNAKNPSVKVGDILFVDFNREICCEVCNEVIHSHLGICPVCRVRDAATDWISDASEYVGDEFDCEECGTTFLLKELVWGEYEARLEVVKLGEAK